MFAYVLSDDPFADITVVGALDPWSAASYLTEVGDYEIAEKLRAVEPGSRTGTRASWSAVKWPFFDKPWQYTSHAFGYIPLAVAGSSARIVAAGTVQAEESLRGAAIDITLDRLRVADYPGGSTHHILLDFYARNRTTDSEERLHYNMYLRAREGQEAAVVGYPIFIGLNIGDSGVGLRCLTVNVKNDADETFLKFLGSDVFRNGLQLAKIAQPALMPFSEMVLGITKSIAQRNRNVAVQEFFLGLDFSAVMTRARIVQGSYIAVQIPDRIARVWDWNDWIYDGPSGQIVSCEDGRTLIPFNYVVLGVSRSNP
jgi:hypothetical protein